MRDDPDDRRGAAMHDGGSKATNKPQAKRGVAQALQVMDILYQCETGTDGKPQNGRIDSEANLAGSNQQQQV